MMKRNCNLELRLSPNLHQQEQEQEQEQETEQEQQSMPEKRQQLTIFYNGTVCVGDVTELQARAILLLARREKEDYLNTPNGSEPSSPTNLPAQQLVGNTTVINSNNPTPTGLSMKRSLQRFLQKRKTRIQATSPYNY